MHQVRFAEPPSRIGTDLRAMLTAVGQGDDVLGGIGLIGLRLPGLALVIDAVLVLPRGIVVVSGVDLPGPAVQLVAPAHGSWFVDGWRLVRPGGHPVDGALAATGAVGARLGAPGVPELPVSAVVAVGPYVREIVRPNGDGDRPPTVLHPTPRRLVRAVADLAKAPARVDVATAERVLHLLVPRLTLDARTLLDEGFAAGDGTGLHTGDGRGPGTGDGAAPTRPVSRGPAPGGRW